MAKPQAAQTLPPEHFSTGQPITATEANLVVAQIGYSVGRAAKVHVSQAAYGFDDGYLHPHGEVYFPSTTGAGSAILHYEFDVRIDADVGAVRVGAVCEMKASNGGDVNFTVGGGSTSISFAEANNGTEKTATISTASTGTGQRTVQIELELTSGASAVNKLMHFRVEDAEVAAADLPDPEAA